MTKLVEFKNHKGEILRGLFDKAKSKRGIVFVHGFERTTIESKFKHIVDQLKGKINLFRFDFSGCGLSDGDFSDLTVKKLSEELNSAIEKFKAISGAKDISFVGHSLGCAIILNYLSTIGSNDFDKLVFLAPALNQRKLQQFWFVKSATPEAQINWSNFQEYFSGLSQEFAKSLDIKTRTTKEHLINNKYFLETSAMDYQDILEMTPYWRPSKSLIVHGDSDDKVPVESNNSIPKTIKIVKVGKGDHDLQRPDMVKQYLDKVVDFLKE